MTRDLSIEDKSSSLKLCHPCVFSLNGICFRNRLLSIHVWFSEIYKISFFSNFLFSIPVFSRLNTLKQKDYIMNF